MYEMLMMINRISLEVSLDRSDISVLRVWEVNRRKSEISMEVSLDRSDISVMDVWNVNEDKSCLLAFLCS